ncbi:unnamed protein product [Nyctereutes procyonoides]|uniref:(raccoon dog) hypothetical protein n=1 Tax=Nyctereutes procyonoides TaxID=34880 RepID=A0A811YKY9_NYCPR|nr:unnamed protein product [Nyctereutes procyonoides]
MSSGASMNALQRLVKLLKLEAGMERIKYSRQSACKDALLVGVPAGRNIFQEPRSCALS